MAVFVDTHCHLDAPEFGDEIPLVRARAAQRNVALCVIPAVAIANFARVRELAHAQDDAYALGIHPMCTGEASDEHLAQLDAELAARRDDPRLVAVGEIGLDFFVPGLDADKQAHFFHTQLQLARKYELPVIIHVRRSVDQVLKHLRQVAPDGRWLGIAHAFNGSAQQAQACIKLGLKLGFGGALTFERALQLRRLATELPLEAIVLETDSPDIQPQWLYRTQAQRAAGEPQARNEPGELPRIAGVLAGLRGIAPEVLAEASTRNAVSALPRLSALMGASAERRRSA
ncbi:MULTISPECIES: TatD family hydrolase [unclassified Variovorax]|uniref:TatD family hydrolase n=1 Tax=unclassified Variovorax TaxID=663243 RepID=UPI00076C85A5|nr:MULTISPECIES: TatD family hydrolase [unclassified Variovorax]KWT79205.1 putative deoxyribonuclease YjjV [Variovorax sp. WDL1]PNG55433.1 putative metal-dependent hydrolase YjjV [Variovorax sp. B4]PNG56857.1 putative metal-dependent hydrolase YjjV [Variovorax sp. B2]VTV10878.1 putative deoxyribonuclease YjjV [Variovorax sp. WDL1]